MFDKENPCMMSMFLCIYVFLLFSGLGFMHLSFFGVHVAGVSLSLSCKNGWLLLSTLKIE